MLEEVRIRNLGVITDATLPLGPGLTVVTGETGAGKTMVVAGLTLLFGARSDSSQISRGAESADVEGSLIIDPDGPAAERCRDAGGSLEDDRLILSRTVSAQGRSRASAGGRSVPVGVLADIGERELTVHGQASQLRLARGGQQREVLDRFGGAAHAKLLQAYLEAYVDWQQLVRRLSELRRDDSARRQEIAMLRLGLEQIERADVREGEDEEIDTEVRRLSNADALRQSTAAALAAIGGEGELSESAGADMQLASAVRALADADDQQLRELAERLRSVGVELADITAELSGFAATLHDDPQRLSDLMTRKAELRELVRNYSSSADLAGVLAWSREAGERLIDIDTSSERLERLEAERIAAQEAARSAAAALSDSRRALAKRLAKAVNAELASLALGASRILIDVSARPLSTDVPELDGAGATESGCDRVRILLAHGSADEGRPIDKSASGGELSRIMLAIEVVLAGTDPIGTMVFDEVDAGVGGEAAIEIGRRLAVLSTTHQVIVVTHLPQVAAYADRHVKITKRSEGAVVASGIELLEQQQRLDELTRMLAGLSDSASGRAHAAELLGAADHDKKRRTRQ
ncbi:DNA repair protein RecN [Cumulibacter soli]|uniref:DNA repair protein RecN n=1 Tax=Cumulibacter soli TaxID=2546344 RepID=UPI0010682112|nr:DNA repair protein RecN [Cumulibacter soli]